MSLNTLKVDSFNIILWRDSQTESVPNFQIKGASFKLHRHIKQNYSNRYNIMSSNLSNVTVEISELCLIYTICEITYLLQAVSF